MDYLKNHCFCTRSHWDNKHFDCQIIVSLSSYEDHDKEDWQNLTQKVRVFSQKKFDEEIETTKRMMERYPEDYDHAYFEKVRTSEHTGFVTINVFKPEVLDWLDKNVPDMKNGDKAWCVGSNDYNANDSSSLKVFMQRRKDAMLFIKTFSKWQKPVYYCQYFTEVRKELDLNTLKYKKV